MITRRLEDTLLPQLLMPRVMAVALPLAAAQASAQTLDSLTMITRGSDVVAVARFNAPVRFVRQAPLGPTQLLRVDFEPSPATRASPTRPSRRADRPAAWPTRPM